MPEECSLDEIDEDGYKTCIRGRLLEYWAQVVDDPGKTCASWTYKGAPAGLEIPTDDLDGVFPSAQEEDQEVHAMGSTDHRLRQLSKLHRCGG